MIDSSTCIADRYRVDARLGGGGMADVFDAYDLVLDRPVAIKLLRGIDEAGAARRFAEEIRLTARVNHPNIVGLYDAGEHNGSPYLVLERVTGGTLAGEMDHGPLEPTRVAELGEQLASALSHSHAAGIVHRDVKPTNVLLTPDGSVRLADFGIAVTATATRLTVTGTIAGSAGYVSPEQVLGSGAGAPSDVYALGLVLLECLTGAPPWSGTTVEVALARVSSDPRIPEDLPPGWAPLLAGMTARNPEDRPHIDLVGHALSRLAVGETYDTTLVAPPVPADRRVPVVAGMSVLVLLMSAFTVLGGNATPDIALAEAAPAISVPAAEALLEPAVALSPAEPVPDWVIAEPRIADPVAQDDRRRRPVRRPTAAASSKAQPKAATTRSTAASKTNATAAAPAPTVQKPSAPAPTKRPSNTTTSPEPNVRSKPRATAPADTTDTPQRTAPEPTKTPTKDIAVRDTTGTKSSASGPSVSSPRPDDVSDKLDARQAKKRRAAKLRALRLETQNAKLTRAQMLELESYEPQSSKKKKTSR